MGLLQSGREQPQQPHMQFHFPQIRLLLCMGKVRTVTLPLQQWLFLPPSRDGVAARLSSQSSAKPHTAAFPGLGLRIPGLISGTALGHVPESNSL
ncbi:hypothetical protein MLD38_026179 [Melastoma candidum]|uniref:Uncharacterized protein n=1 Tax=Melastoma candidum TaxID=119954 RepID=A0ACB9NXR7_9MYRT|nr:hypothetical protein MLD38_026179 [Melastoma candidum]